VNNTVSILIDWNVNSQFVLEKGAYVAVLKYSARQ